MTSVVVDSYAFTFIKISFLKQLIIDEITLRKLKDINDVQEFVEFIGFYYPGMSINKYTIEEIEREVDYFKNFCNPEFYVVQTGSLVKEINQVGTFNKYFIEEAAIILHEKNIKLKEHNADYLSRDGSYYIPGFYLFSVFNENFKID